MIAASFFVTATGLAVPIQVAGAVISTVGAGLLYTLDLHTDSGKWIGYQIVGGVGWGMAQELPIIVGQAFVDPEDISAVTAIIQCLSHLFLHRHELLLTNLDSLPKPWLRLPPLRLPSGIYQQTTQRHSENHTRNRPHDAD